LTAVAHSWLDCVDWDTAAQTCRGFARNWYKNPAVPFATDVGRDNRPGLDVPAGLFCDRTKEQINDPVSGGYNAEYPMAWVTPGQSLVWRWPAKNHADVGTQRNVQLFISRGPGLGDDFSHITSKTEWVNQYPNLESTFSNCYLNGEKVGPAVDKAICYGTFEIPTHLQEGVYTFMWWWEFNGGEFYNSCADVTIGLGTKPTPMPTASSAPTPSPVGDCGNTWGQCGGSGWSGPTCCATGDVCRSFNEWYSQCVPDSSQMPTPIPTTPAPTMMPTATQIPTPLPTMMPSRNPETCDLEVQSKNCVQGGGTFICDNCVDGSAGEVCCQCKDDNELETTTETTTTQMTATSIPPVCKSWCAGSKKNWQKKCEWDKCSGCPECSGRRLGDTDVVLV